MPLACSCTGGVRISTSGLGEVALHNGVAAGAFNRISW